MQNRKRNQHLKTLSEEDEKEIVTLAKNNRWKSWQELASYFEKSHPNKKCWRDRFREVCWKQGVKGVVASKKPFISDENAKKRLEFSQKYKDWTKTTDWEATAFIDESKINL